jgi:hypothetical protein
MQVQHDEHGIGTITEVKGFGETRMVRVRFVTAGVKAFFTQKVKLKVLRG